MRVLLSWEHLRDGLRSRSNLSLHSVNPRGFLLKPLTPKCSHKFCSFLNFRWIAWNYFEVKEICISQSINLAFRLIYKPLSLSFCHFLEVTGLKLIWHTKMNLTQFILLLLTNRSYGLYKCWSKNVNFLKDFGFCLFLCLYLIGNCILYLKNVEWYQ